MKCVAYLSKCYHVITKRKEGIAEGINVIDAKDKEAEEGD